MKESREVKKGRGAEEARNEREQWREGIVESSEGMEESREELRS